MTESTGIKAEGNCHDGQPLKPEGEATILMASYSKIFDQLKLHNENYFKRVQVVMGVLQGGLFLAVLQRLSPFPKSGETALLPLFLGFLGILSAFTWIKLHTTQVQYLEFCRRILRNLEAKLTSLGVPLEYFTTESLVFGPYREHPPKLNSGTIKTVELGKSNKRHLMRFGWSNETYPDLPGSKTLNSIVNVAGRLGYFERRIAWVFMFVWILVIAGVAANLWAQFL